MSTTPSSGSRTSYELDEEQFNAAIDLLKQQRQNVGEYWSAYTAEVEAFPGGDSTVGTTWQVITNLLQDEGAPVENTLPEEGSTGWSDTWMISSEAAHPNCMYLWMDHVVSPEVNAQIAEYFGEAPANQKSCALTEVKNHCEIFHADDEEFFGPGRVLDHSDKGLRRRPRRGLQDLRRVGPGLDGSEGLIR